MDAIDWILNLACILLWLNWRSIRFSGLPASGVSLAGTLRRADPIRTPRWSSLAGLAGIVAVRSLFYFQIGSAVSWNPRLQLGAVALTFRSAHFPRMFLFSCLSFGIWLGGLYAWLFFISALNGQTPDTDPWQRLVRLHLGRVERCPPLLKLLMPAVIASVGWLLVHPLLVRATVVPQAQPPVQIFAHALVLGAASALWWKVLLLGLLVLHILNSYLYLGKNPFWHFVNTTAKHLLQFARLDRLRVGKIDFAPVAGITAVVILSELLESWLPVVYQHL